MANVLRDFFILEFAIYNFGNVTKQFRWIANGLAQIDEEFNSIESRLQRIGKLSQQIKDLEKVLPPRDIPDEELPENILDARKNLEELKKQLVTSVAELEKFNVKAYVTEQVFSRISALAVTKFGMLSLVFKTFLDNFVRLQKVAIDFQDSLGITERHAFALAKAFENIGISGSQLASSIASFQKRFFSDLKLPMLLVRFGVEPSKIFTGNIMDFINEIVKVSDALKGFPTFQRAFLLEVLGKDLIDIIRIISKYNIRALIEDYRKVFSDEMISRTRRVIITLQLVTSQFWVIISPFVENLTVIINRIASFIIKLMELVENVPLVRFIVNVITFVTSISSLYLGIGFLIRSVVSAHAAFTTIFTTMRYLLLENAIIAKIFNKSLMETSSAIGIAQLMTSGLGLGRLFASSIASSMLLILGLTGVMSVFGSRKSVGNIEDNTAKIAYNTSLTNMYLYNLTYDIRNAIKTTALGGTVPPLYQIINMQTALYYSLATNSSVMWYGDIWTRT